MSGRKRGSVRWSVERWFERELHSDLRGEAKNHLDRSQISVASEPIRPRVWPRRGIAANSAGSCAMGARAIVGRRRAKKAGLRPSPPQMTFFDEIEARGAEGIQYLTTSM